MSKKLNIRYDEVAPLSFSSPMKTESVVKSRYAEGAKAREESLCCPVDYDPRYLKVIPQEVIDRDYGCGDPSRYVHAGETVLDLGSGTGKICFIASQVVGAEGRVSGVDMTQEVLEVARRNAPIAQPSWRSSEHRSTSGRHTSSRNGPTVRPCATSFRTTG